MGTPESIVTNKVKYIRKLILIFRCILSIEIKYIHRYIVLQIVIKLIERGLDKCMVSWIYGKIIRCRLFYR